MTEPKANTDQLLLVVISILFPPLAVWLKHGFGGALLLSVVLTLLGYLPGQIHAVWVSLR